jgi:tetratricopeptide (TPR) repeat protein
MHGKAVVMAYLRRSRPESRQRASFCLVTSVFLFCSLAYAQTNQSGGIRLHYARAQEALKANQLDVAAQEFEEILRLDPHNAEARASLGAIAFNQSNFPQAVKEFQESLKLKPELWNAQAFLGMSEMRVGKLEEAKTHLEKALPHLQQEKLRTQAGSDLITIYYMTGNLEEAAAVAKVLESLEPNNPDTLYTAYRVHSDLAAHALATLVKVAPESARTREILAQSLMSRNDFPGAILEYRRALESDPHLSEIHFELGEALLKYSASEPNLSEAEKEFKAAVAANPADSNAEYELGEVALSRSDLQNAFQHYSRALQLRPHFVEAQIGLGKVLTAMSEPRKALDYLLEAERSDPQNETVHFRLALAYRKLGVKADAEREYKAFQDIRKTQDALRPLYQEIELRPATTQTAEPAQPK